MAADGTSIPYGKRLFQATLDEIAENTPKQIFACIPRTSNLKDGFKDVTFGDYARAVDRTSWWLEGLLGKSTTFETLAYIGPWDLRYFILIFAAPKVGYKIFLPSPRNSLAGQLNLFSKTSCDVLITTPVNAVQEYLDNRPMRLVNIPELGDLLASGEVPRYKYTKTFEEAKEDPSLVLHTSGSSGLPKPVFLAHQWVCSTDSAHILPFHDGYEPDYMSFNGRRIFCCMPPFHIASIIGNLISGIFFGSISIWPPANRPMSAPLVEEVLDSIPIDIIFCAPSILEDISQSPDSVKKLSKLKAVHFGGGPLSNLAGNIVRQHVTLCNTIGTTETAHLPLYRGPKEDWAYFHNNPNLEGIEFRPYTEDLFEMVLVRHPSTDRYHSAFINFPHLTEYPLSDLYAKHPTKSNSWLYVGRADDVIVLSNGEKLTPVAMEASLRDHPGVNGALVVGQGKFSTAAIIELTPDMANTVKTSEERARFIESLWPYTVAANANAPTHAILAIDRIMIAPADKPFSRAGKGTVQRGATVKLFENEIEELYQRSEETATLDVPKIDLDQDFVILQRQLGTIVEMVSGIRLVGAEKDFFSTGMDSLHIMQLEKHLRSALIGSKVPQDKIDTRVIYTNPTLETLAGALKALSQSADVVTNGDHSPDTREKRMEEMLQKYLSLLPTSSDLSAKQLSTRKSGHTVILTGSTGSLGSYLLDNLARRPEIQKVYCLNRRVDAEDWQTESNSSRGLVSKWGTRVAFLHADLSRPHLGLSEEGYTKLVKEATVIIHNQWQVDFNLFLSSFEPHIAGVSKLIALSSESSNSPPIFFTSSIGTVRFWNDKHPNELLPEKALVDPSVSEHQGYSESKWIAERLLDAAAKNCGVSSAICRVGQIAGPVEKGVKGAWNTQEWLPSIIASSKYLGLVPESLGSLDDVSWTPVDILSRIVVELVLKTSEKDTPYAKYYHLENPRSCKWSSLVPVIQKYLASPGKAAQAIDGNTTNTESKAVSFQDWVKALEDSGKQSEGNITKNPGLKLLEFYKGLSQSRGAGVKLDTAETNKESETMRNLKAVDDEWMRLWLEQWKF